MVSGQSENLAAPSPHEGDAAARASRRRVLEVKQPFQPGNSPQDEKAKGREKGPVAAATHEVGSQDAVFFSGLPSGGPAKVGPAGRGRGRPRGRPKLSKKLSRTRKYMSPRSRQGSADRGLQVPAACAAGGRPRVETQETSADLGGCGMENPYDELGVVDSEGDEPGARKRASGIHSVGSIEQVAAIISLLSVGQGRDELASATESEGGDLLRSSESSIFPQGAQSGNRELCFMQGQGAWAYKGDLCGVSGNEPAHDDGGTNDALHGAAEAPSRLARPVLGELEPDQPHELKRQEKCAMAASASGNSSDQSALEAGEGHCSAERDPAEVESGMSANQELQQILSIVQGIRRSGRRHSPQAEQPPPARTIIVGRPGGVVLVTGGVSSAACRQSPALLPLDALGAATEVPVLVAKAEAEDPNNSMSQVEGGQASGDLLAQGSPVLRDQVDAFLAEGVPDDGQVHPLQEQAPKEPLLPQRPGSGLVALEHIDSDCLSGEPRETEGVGGGDVAAQLHSPTALKPPCRGDNNAPSFVCMGSPPFSQCVDDAVPETSLKPVAPAGHELVATPAPGPGPGPAPGFGAGSASCEPYSLTGPESPSPAKFGCKVERAAHGGPVCESEADADQDASLFRQETASSSSSGPSEVTSCGEEPRTEELDLEHQPRTDPEPAWAQSAELEILVACVSGSNGEEDEQLDQMPEELGQQQAWEKDHLLAACADSAAGGAVPQNRSSPVRDPEADRLHACSDEHETLQETGQDTPLSKSEAPPGAQQEVSSASSKDYSVLPLREEAAAASAEHVAPPHVLCADDEISMRGEVSAVNGEGPGECVAVFQGTLTQNTYHRRKKKHARDVEVAPEGGSEMQGQSRVLSCAESRPELYLLEEAPGNPHLGQELLDISDETHGAVHPALASSVVNRVHPSLGQQPRSAATVDLNVLHRDQQQVMMPIRDFCLPENYPLNWQLTFSCSSCGHSCTMPDPVASEHIGRAGSHADPAVPVAAELVPEGGGLEARPEVSQTVTCDGLRNSSGTALETPSRPAAVANVQTSNTAPTVPPLASSHAGTSRPCVPEDLDVGVASLEHRKGWLEDGVPDVSFSDTPEAMHRGSKFQQQSLAASGSMFLLTFASPGIAISEEVVSQAENCSRHSPCVQPDSLLHSHCRPLTGATSGPGEKSSLQDDETREPQLVTSGSREAALLPVRPSEMVDLSEGCGPTHAPADKCYAWKLHVQQARRCRSNRKLSPAGEFMSECACRLGGWARVWLWWQQDSPPACSRWQQHRPCRGAADSSAAFWHKPRVYQRRVTWDAGKGCWVKKSPATPAVKEKEGAEAEQGTRGNQGVESQTSKRRKRKLQDSWPGAKKSRKHKLRHAEECLLPSSAAAESLPVTFPSTAPDCQGTSACESEATPSASEERHGVLLKA